MPTKVPSIEEFPEDGRTWRIDWLGRVERGSAEVRIDVHLSPARQQGRHLRDQNGFDADATIKIRVGIGLLPFLAIGSLWRDGRRLRQDFGCPRQLRNVEIPKAIRSATAGLILHKKPETRWLIPRFRHQLDRSCWFSPLFAIEHEGDPYGILLPMIEAIRFYYAVSSDMAHVAFNGAIQLNLDAVINTRSAIDSRLQDSGRMVLHLRQWLADDDAWVIGRVLADAHANDGIARVYDSLLRDTAKYKTAFAECGLPFEGATTWTTRGIDVPKENGRGQRWLIYEIIDCSAPFPFDELEVVRDNDGRTGSPGLDFPEDEKRPAWAPAPKMVNLGADTTIQSNDPPRADLQAVIIPSSGERFAALHGKEIIKIPKDQCRYKKATVPDAEAIDQIGTGDSSSSLAAQGAPASIEWQRETKRREALPASFESLMNVVDALDRLPNVAAYERRSTSATEYLPLSKPNGYAQWAYLNSSQRICRRVMAVDIECGGAMGCLIEFERRENERSRVALFVGKFPGVSEVTLIRLLHGLVTSQGVWANLRFRPADLKLELFNHSRPSAEKFAVDILDSLLAHPG